MNDYQDVIADLEAKLKRLDAERAEIITAIGAIKKIMGLETPPVRGLAPRSAPYASMTVLGASKKILDSEDGGPLGAGEIARRLRAGGFQNNSKSLTNTVYSILYRAMEKGDNIERAGTGWRLTSERSRKTA